MPELTTSKKKNTPELSSRKRLAVIGDPISHSLSPILQNFLLSHFSLPFAYEALHVTTQELPKVIALLRTGELAGVNVTLPHKQTVIPFLDELASPADRIGAVNTIVRSAGKLIGHNTDAAGFLRCLQAAHFAIAQQDVLVLGAGGAAAAVLFALFDADAGMVYICNRDLSRAKKLCAGLSQPLRQRVRLVEWEKRSECVQTCSLSVIINATSVGMSPAIDASPLPSEAIRAEMVIIDLVYNPLETRLLRTGKEKGATTIGGLAMLIYQGVAALELWSGRKLEIEEIYESLESRLIAECLNSRRMANEHRLKQSPS